MSNDLLNLAIQEILDTYDAILWNDNYYNDVVQAIFNVYIQDFFQRTGWNSATTKKFFYEYYKKFLYYNI